MRTLFHRLFRRLARDERGGVALIFGLAAPALMGLTMAAIDYGIMSAQRAKLQAASDAVALKLGPMAATKSADELQVEATKILKNFAPDGSFTAEKPEISSGRTEITIRAWTDYKTKYLQAPGLDTFTLRTLSKAIISKTTYEIALVLDNSGSMAASAGGVSKMDAVKAAARQLVSALYGNDGSAQRTKVAVVPFTLSVNVGSQYANASWIDTQGKSSIHWQNVDRAASSWKPNSRLDIFRELGMSWGGCVESRPGSFGTNDASPTSGEPDSLFVPQFAPDEPGNAGDYEYDFQSGNGNAKKWNTYYYANSYIDDNAGTCTVSDRTAPDAFDAAQRKLCKYRNRPAVNAWSGRGPNHMCDAKPLTRLSGNQSALVAAINDMQAGGNTDILEGFAWGWRTISPNTPFADGRAYGDQDNKKIIVLMTDGVNAWNSMDNHNGSMYSPFGFYTNERLGKEPNNANQARQQMDAKTLEACDNAKAQGVQVYTVGFSTPQSPIDQGGMAILKQCATSPQMAYVAKDATAILDVFNEIARNIGGLRLAM